MNQYPTYEQVRNGLGDKVIDILAQAITKARYDLSQYRHQFPNFAAQHSARGLANWISDRIWHHVEALSERISVIHIVMEGTTREMWVEGYRIRFKRHDKNARVGAIPTQTALEFFSQPVQLQIEGLETVNLTAGYLWLKDSREIGPAVISLRDGKENVIWVEELDEGSSSVRPLPAQPKPEAPRIYPNARLLDSDVDQRYRSDN